MFTICSCRLSDIGKRLQLYRAYTLLDCFVNDSSADFMVLVCHPTLLFVSGFTDSLKLFRLSEFLAAFGTLLYEQVQFQTTLFCVWINETPRKEKAR